MPRGIKETTSNYYTLNEPNPPPRRRSTLVQEEVAVTALAIQLHLHPFRSDMLSGALKATVFEVAVYNIYSSVYAEPYRCWESSTNGLLDTEKQNEANLSKEQQVRRTSTLFRNQDVLYHTRALRTDDDIVHQRLPFPDGFQ